MYQLTRRGKVPSMAPLTPRPRRRARLQFTSEELLILVSDIVVRKHILLVTIPFISLD